jgi:hypothetical protein
MIERLLLAGLALCAWPNWGNAADISPEVSFSGKASVVLPLIPSPDRKVFVKARIRGQAVTLLLDTGASQILDAGVAGKLGLTCTSSPETGYGLTGSVEKAEVTLIDMDLNGLDIWRLRATCLDMTGLRKVGQQFGMPVPDGVLSAEVLTLLRARIDLDKMTLELRLPTQSSLAEDLRRRNASAH